LLARIEAPSANQNHSQIITLANAYRHTGSDSVLEAEQLVQSFLAADGWQRKARYVRDPMRVGKMMQEYYTRNESGAKPLNLPVTVNAAPPTYYYFSEQTRNLQSVVEVATPDGTVQNFLVEFLPSGPKIEWESSVAYAPVPWDKMVATAQTNAQPKEQTNEQPTATYLQRVSVRLDDYYNYEFNDRSKYISLYLEDPTTGAPLGNGYLRRDSEDAPEALQALASTNYNRDQLQRVILEVQPQPTTAQHRLIPITRFIKSGFRTPAPTTVASAQ
jgi:hypothetical protein